MLDRSQGLGNPKGNSLPSCQIRFLDDMLHRCSKHINPTSNDSALSLPFWLDTLCIPLETSLRRQAILRMRETYENAAMVVVLDEEVLSFAGHWYFRIQRLLQSNWLRRLWTYQEAILASKLYVAFADELVNVLDLGRRSVNYSITVSFWGQMRVETLLSGVSPFAKDVHRIMSAVESLHRRTTTKRGDEFICLATILDLDLETLPTRPDMTDIIRRLDQIPQELLFTPGPRLDAKGFRWAPVSFLEQWNRSYSREEHYATLLEQGLSVCVHAKFVDGTVLASGSRTESSKYFIESLSSQGQVVALLNVLNYGTGLWASFATEIDNPLILSPVVPETGRTCNAIVVRRLRQDEETWYCQYGAFATITTYAPSRDGEDTYLGRYGLLNVTGETTIKVIVD